MGASRQLVPGLPGWPQVRPLLSDGEVKGLEICYRLESLSLICISNILVESNCLEVISLLNGVVVDIFEVCFFIVEAKECGNTLGVVAYSHIRRSRNTLVYCIRRKVLEDRKSSILHTPYPTWFTLLLSSDVLL